MKNPKTTLAELFEKHYHAHPTFSICSPGRVNLIGEHTDYNDGFVLPMALEQATWLAITPRSDARIHAYSHNFQESTEIDMSSLKKPNHKDMHWSEYICGVVDQLQKMHGALRGFTATIYGDVPVGAGLSSSASFELGIARALAIANDIPWQPTEMAQCCQRAENEWIGVNCGIMDQLICAVGKKDHACLLDCRTLETKAVPLPANVVVMIMDTSTRRGLVDSAYNERRGQCEAVAKQWGVRALRDISLTALQARKEELDPLAYQRAHHVVSENERVLAAVSAMQNNDPVTLGVLMKASHDSLDRDFAVTNNALNTIVQHANQTDGCFGARMTGAGFGGCAVALVAQDKAALVAETVSSLYTRDTGLTPKIYVTHASEGCHATGY